LPQEGTLRESSLTPVREALKLLEAEGYINGDSYREPASLPSWAFRLVIAQIDLSTLRSLPHHYPLRSLVDMRSYTSVAFKLI
jgi:hypothetical protein